MFDGKVAIGMVFDVHLQIGGVLEGPHMGEEGAVAGVGRVLGHIVRVSLGGVVGLRRGDRSAGIDGPGGTELHGRIRRGAPTAEGMGRDEVNSC